MSTSVASIISELRMRLNDADGGAYTDNEIRAALLLALNDTEMATRCHLIEEVQMTSIGQATYTFTAFEPLELTYGGTPLTKRTLPDLVAQHYTSTAQDGTPGAYAITSGGTVMLWPVPVAEAQLKMIGYGTTESLGSYITSVPSSVVSQTVTNRAEMILRMWRPTVSGNVEVASALGQLFQSFARSVTR